MEQINKFLEKSIELLHLRKDGTPIVSTNFKVISKLKWLKPYFFFRTKSDIPSFMSIDEGLHIIETVLSKVIEIKNLVANEDKDK